MKELLNYLLFMHFITLVAAHEVGGLFGVCEIFSKYQLFAEINGDPCAIRTRDLLIKSQLLYQLS